MSTEASFTDRVIRFCLENRLVVTLLTLGFIFWGILHAPFDWKVSWLHRDPVPVDAIPDIGENQQIVFADWMGRSPQDVEDQVTYPLTVSLLGVPEVKTIRSYSAFGFSMIFVIFNEDAEFYWSRSRVLEKLNSLPSGTLPEGVQPMLGPDATGLGQVFWYTLEGRTPDGQPAGGWAPDELRSIQDWTVRYALQSAEGVSEVASIGGFVKEYQVDVDPDAMRAHGVTLPEVMDAVRQSNLDVGASVLEVNRVEYAIRGVGFVKSVEDLEKAVVKVTDNVPIYVGQVAKVVLGPGLRRGALDREGAEAVGGVVVVRYGENPLAAIADVKEKIREISAGLPEKTLADGTKSKVTLVPFYDRTSLIHETLDTLNEALLLEILITTIVVLVMARHFTSSLLISAVMPLSVLCTFIAMRFFKVDANIVSLSGIAIAIGTIVDMGIIICENILKHMEAARKAGLAITRREVVFKASSEVGGAVVTAIATTVVSFLPVFMMDGAEGKLFKPLAFTKTFALMASVVIALTIIPSFAEILFMRKTGIATPRGGGKKTRWVDLAAMAAVTILLAMRWLPAGPERGIPLNLIFAILPIGLILGVFMLYQRFYKAILGWCLCHKRIFLSGIGALVFTAVAVWIGLPRMTTWMPDWLRLSRPVSAVTHAFPGLGKEFMPPLDEGSYLFMPSAMPHASIGETMDILQKQDLAIGSIPEVETVVGKLGRVESALDPAPVPMIETLINYFPPYLLNAEGKRLAFKFEKDETDLFRDVNGAPVSAPDGKPYSVQGRFERDDKGQLIPDAHGRPFPLWRAALDPDLNEGREPWPGIRSPDDIWDEIVRMAEVPGSTSAPRLQPIATRIVMLQSGMRAPMGLKVYGPDLASVEKAGLLLEKELKQVPLVNPATVIADRIVGKPYLEIVPDRQALARYGVSISEFQDILETAIGGMQVSRSVEGRERYAIRVRYLRELRDTPEALERILVPTMDGASIPLVQVAAINYVRGPEMIRSEDTFLTGYVLFDKVVGSAEVDVVNQAADYLKERVANGEIILPAGVHYSFAGSYENQIRAAKKLAVVIPLALFVIFLILYFQFREYLLALYVFAGIIVAWSGGFILIWFYGQSWFMDFTLFGIHMRELFQVHPINLSVAVWVGFLALFGIASDDGVVMCTYLKQRFTGASFNTVAEVRAAVIEAGERRIRPCLMTTATTVLALLPVLTSSGRGSDIMVPMAIPSFGGMMIEVLTTLVTPVLFSVSRERRLKRQASES